MRSCKEVSELLSQAQERRLGLGERLDLELHLMLCNGCTHFRRQLDFMRVALRRYVNREDQPR